MLPHAVSLTSLSLSLSLSLRLSLEAVAAVFLRRVIRRIHSGETYVHQIPLWMVHYDEFVIRGPCPWPVCSTIPPPSLLPLV